MHARLSGARQAGTPRQRGPSVESRRCTPTALRARTPEFRGAPMRSPLSAWWSGTITARAGSGNTTSRSFRSPCRCRLRWRPCSPPGARRTAGRPTTRRRGRGFSCGGSRSSWPARNRCRVTRVSSPRRWCGGGGHGCLRAPEAITPSAWSAACCLMTRGFRRDRSPTRLARRSRKPRSRTQSYGEAEFDRVRAAARRRFRAALQRINETPFACSNGGTMRSPRAAASG